MNNKLIVFLFPAINFTKIQEEAFQESIDSELKLSDIFDTIIEERYLNNQYDFMIATYPDRPIYGITLEPCKVVYSKENYDTFYDRPLDDIMDDYKYMALQLDLEKYSEIVVGGYHLGDCVDKFASAIESCSKAKVSIDKEITSDILWCGFTDSDDNYNKDFEFYDSIQRRKQNRISTEQAINDYNMMVESMKENLEENDISAQVQTGKKR